VADAVVADAVVADAVVADAVVADAVVADAVVADASVAVALYVFNITFVTFKYNVFGLLSNDDDIAMSRYVYINVL
jgi:hypothetical protein